MKNAKYKFCNYALTHKSLIQKRNKNTNWIIRNLKTLSIGNSKMQGEEYEKPG